MTRHELHPIARSELRAIAIFMLGADMLNLLRNGMQMGLKTPYTGRAELAGRNLEIIEAGGMEGSVSAWTYSPDIPNPANRKFATTIAVRHKTQATLLAWAGYDSMQAFAAAIRLAKSAEPDKIRDALTKVNVTMLHGKTVSFDDRNQAGRVVVIQGVKNRRVEILELFELK